MSLSPVSGRGRGGRGWIRYLPYSSKFGGLYQPELASSRVRRPSIALGLLFFFPLGPFFPFWCSENSIGGSVGCQMPPAVAEIGTCCLPPPPYLLTRSLTRLDLVVVAVSSGSNTTSLSTPSSPKARCLLDVWTLVRIALLGYVWTFSTALPDWSKAFRHPEGVPRRILSKHPGGPLQYMAPDRSFLPVISRSDGSYVRPSGIEQSRCRPGKW